MLMQLYPDLREKCWLPDETGLGASKAPRDVTGEGDGRVEYNDGEAGSGMNGLVRGDLPNL